MSLSTLKITPRNSFYVLKIFFNQLINNKTKPMTPRKKTNCLKNSKNATKQFNYIQLNTNYVHQFGHTVPNVKQSLWQGQGHWTITKMTWHLKPKSTIIVLNDSFSALYSTLALITVIQPLLLSLTSGLAIFSIKSIWELVLYFLRALI